MSGVMSSSRFCYLDTVDEVGVYLELVHDPDGMVMKMMPWWDDSGTMNGPPRWTATAERRRPT